MKKRRTIFKEEILLLFVVISLACSQTKGVDVTIGLERAVGGNGISWSTGYQGDFYVATVSNVVNFGWKFNTEDKKYSFNVDGSNCSATVPIVEASFSARCESTDEGFRSILQLDQPLVETDDDGDNGGIVEFYVEESDNKSQKSFNVTECSTSHPSVQVASEDAKYSSTGNFYCDNGADLYDKGTDTKVEITETVCQADATWKNEDIVRCGANITVTLQREIGDGSDWSIGYQGDFYIATVDTNVVEKIRWKFNDEVEEQQIDKIDGTCRVISTPATSFNSSCEVIDGGMKSILHLNRELTSDDGGFVEFYAKVSKFSYNTSSTTFNVMKCSADSSLKIESEDAKYATTGNFYCDNGGDLYNSNTETKVVNTATVCQVSGTWKDGDVVQCWTAPEDVKLTGVFATKNEDMLSLTCGYGGTSDLVPGVKSFVFYKNGTIISSGESNTSTTSITRNDNGATVRCKAENIVNENYNDLRGYSQNETLTVYYKPSISEIELLNPNKLIIENNKEILMRSDQSLWMNCDVDSNPSAKCTWKFQSNEIVPNECNTTIKLETSGILECQAINEQYADSAIKHVMVTLVKETREPTIFDVTHLDDPKEIFNIRENSSLTVECRVDYEDELGTTFNWMFSDQIISPNKTLELTGINTTEDGDYYCYTTDDFGENNNKFSLNVQYPPRKDESTTTEIITCNFNINSSETCDIEFYSNPNADYCSVLKNGEEFDRFSCQLTTVGDKKQKAEIQSLNVTESDRGAYTLKIVSYQFSLSSLEIEFVIVIEEHGNGDGDGGDDSLIIIICCCVGGFLLILLIIAFILYKRKHKSPVKKSDSKIVAENFNLSPTTAASVHSKNRSAAFNEAYVDDKDVKVDENEYVDIPVDENENTDNSIDEDNNEKIPEIIYSEVDGDGNPSVGQKIEKIPEVIYSELDADGNPATTSPDTNQPTSPTYMDLYSVVSKDRANKQDISPSDGELYSVVIKSKKKPKIPKKPVKTEEESQPTDGDLYSVVDKRKKKPKPPKKPVKIEQEPSPSGDVYSVVDKSKNKPKPPTKPPKIEQEISLYGDVYSVVDKSNKKKKHPDETA